MATSEKMKLVDMQGSEVSVAHQCSELVSKIRTAI